MLAESERTKTFEEDLKTYKAIEKVWYSEPVLKVPCVCLRNTGVLRDLFKDASQMAPYSVVHCTV